MLLQLQLYSIKVWFKKELRSSYSSKAVSNFVTALPFLPSPVRQCTAGKGASVTQPSRWIDNECLCPVRVDYQYINHSSRSRIGLKHLRLPDRCYIFRELHADCRLDFLCLWIISRELQVFLNHFGPPPRPPLIKNCCRFSIENS